MCATEKDNNTTERSSSLILNFKQLKQLNLTKINQFHHLFFEDILLWDNCFLGADFQSLSEKKKSLRSAHTYTRARASSAMSLPPDGSVVSHCEFAIYFTLPLRFGGGGSGCSSGASSKVEHSRDPSALIFKRSPFLVSIAKHSAVHRRRKNLFPPSGSIPSQRSRRKRLLLPR